MPPMADQSDHTPAPIGHCPTCGYDQRGLPAGGRCPECGAPFWPGQVIGEVHRWADDALMGLWSVAVLQGVGGSCALLSAVAFRFSQPAAVMVAMAAAVYLLAGSIWYVTIAIDAAIRFRRPALKNMSAEMRRLLQRWLLIDAALVLVPMLPAAHFLR